jgi:hypothetical protein
VWYLGAQRDGTLSGGVHYNLDEFDESTAQSWSTGLKEILTKAVREPDKNWREL